MRKNGSPAIVGRLAGQPELAAELEVTKTIAFYALMASLRALEGDTTARIESFERAIKSFFLTCETGLCPRVLSGSGVRRRFQSTICFIGSTSINIRINSMNRNQSCTAIHPSFDFVFEPFW